MDERLASIEAQLESLVRRVAVLERRLELGGGRVEPAAGGPVPPPILPAFGDMPLALGRACLILAGGWLLRSLAGAGYWSASSGALAGALYSAVWLLAAGVALGRGHRLDGATVAWSAALMAFPLLWETTGSPAGLPGPFAAALWAAFCTGAWLIGSRHRSAAVLSSVVFLGVPTGAGLVLRSHAEWSWVSSVLLVAAATRIWGQRTDLAWMSGVPLGWAAVTVVLTSAAGLMPSAPAWLAPPRLVGVQAGFVLAAVGSAVIRRRTASLTAGDALAFAAAASVALLAVRLPWDSVTAPRLSAGGAVVLAVLAWLLGRSAAPRPRWLWGVAGAALLLEGTARVLPGASREVAWAALVVLGAVAGRSRPLLAWLAPLFAAALCWSTGDVGVAVGWVDPAGDGWGPVLRSAAAEAVLAGSYLVLAGRTASPTSGRALRGCLLVFAALGATALGVRAAATGVLAAGLDVRVLTAVRIAAPTAVALGLVLVARVPRLPEMRIVGLAMAAAAALQVVGRDLLAGSPASRVAGFLVLGGGLIGATLLLRRRDPNEGDRATLPRGPVPGPSVEAAAPTARAGPETRAADPATGSAPATAATEGVGRVQVEVGEAAEPQDADRADGEPAQQSDGSPRRARRVTHLRTEL